MSVATVIPGMNGCRVKIGVTYLEPDLHCQVELDGSISAQEAIEQTLKAGKAAFEKKCGVLPQLHSLSPSVRTVNGKTLAEWGASASAGRMPLVVLTAAPKNGLLAKLEGEKAGRAALEELLSEESQPKKGQKKKMKNQTQNGKDKLDPELSVINTQKEQDKEKLELSELVGTQKDQLCEKDKEKLELSELISTQKELLCEKDKEKNLLEVELNEKQQQLENEKLEKELLEKDLVNNKQKLESEKKHLEEQLEQYKALEQKLSSEKAQLQEELKSKELLVEELKGKEPKPEEEEKAMVAKQQVEIELIKTQEQLRGVQLREYLLLDHLESKKRECEAEKSKADNCEKVLESLKKMITDSAMQVSGLQKRIASMEGDILRLQIENGLLRDWAKQTEEELKGLKRDHQVVQDKLAVADSTLAGMATKMSEYYQQSQQQAIEIKYLKMANSVLPPYV